LKIEDKVRISINLVLFICASEPTINDMTIKGVINILFVNVVRMIGASFCHVINSVAIFSSDFLVISKNQF
jgi:hypothetical protein